jgi:hypothetical protein
MALDVKVINARETIFYLQTLLPRTVKDKPDVAAALRLFEEWGGYATVDNRALYLLTLFCWRWGELPEDPDRVERALREAVAFAKEHFGRIDVPWGVVHGVERGGEWYPSGGASNQSGPVGALISLHHGEPLRNRPDERGRFPMQKGSSHVMVAQMTDPPRVWSAKPFGNTADPSSHHYADLTELFTEGELKPVWMSREDILAHAESVLGRQVELPLPGVLGRVRSMTGDLVELTALVEGGRITIAEKEDRPVRVAISVGGTVRYRVLDPQGGVLREWRTGEPAADIRLPAVLEVAAGQDG